VHYSEATRAGNGLFFEEHTHQVSTFVSRRERRHELDGYRVRVRVRLRLTLAVT
tara:strand:+ start:118 stop:279 length:162 start_codon:yes stop_codon:yes gene_type:complete